MRKDSRGRRTVVDIPTMSSNPHPGESGLSSKHMGKRTDIMASQSEGVV